MDDILSTSDTNQRELTARDKGLPTSVKEYCSVVAVTAEKKVAAVVSVRRFCAACFCAKRMVGIPASVIRFN